MEKDPKKCNQKKKVKKRMKKLQYSYSIIFMFERKFGGDFPRATQPGKLRKQDWRSLLPAYPWESC